MFVNDEWEPKLPKDLWRAFHYSVYIVVVHVEGDRAMVLGKGVISSQSNVISTASSSNLVVRYCGRYQRTDGSTPSQE